MDHHPAGSRTARDGPAEHFTGQVTIRPVIDAPEPARVRAVHVTFAPGARTNWHTHPLGQTLHVLSGRGRAAGADGRAREIGPGDTVWFAPGERHWHGAAPDAEMIHLAVQEARDGVAVDWQGPVADEDYGRLG